MTTKDDDDAVGGCRYRSCHHLTNLLNAFIAFGRLIGITSTNQKESRLDIEPFCSFSSLFLPLSFRSLPVESFGRLENAASRIVSADVAAKGLGREFPSSPASRES